MVNKFSYELLETILKRFLGIWTHKPIAHKEMESS